MPKTKRDPFQYRITAMNETGAELYIYGDIGGWDEESTHAAQLVKELSTLRAEYITVRINSIGGSVVDGLAIYNALRRNPAAVTVSIDGQAASIASLIAMAGDTVSIAGNGLMMIHDPRAGVIGNAGALRDAADMLDKHGEAMAQSYADKTGMTVDEVLAQYLDGADHWLTATEAHEAGFVDMIGDEIAIAAIATRPDIYARLPAVAAAFFNNAEETNPMPVTEGSTTKPAASNAPADDKTVDTKTVDASADQLAQARRKALADDMHRRDEVRALFKPFESREGMADVLAQCLDDHEVGVEQARARLLDQLGKGVEPVGAITVVDQGDARDKFVAGCSAALLNRIGAPGAEPVANNEFRGMRLVDMARASLDRAGMSTRGLTPMEIAREAFAQTSSDFPVLLENTMHRTVVSNYQAVATTWQRFCKTGRVTDFREWSRISTAFLSSLDDKTEGGEFKPKNVPDGSAEKIKLGTKGNIILLSREAVVNDDLGAFSNLGAGLGRAAMLTVEKTVYALLNSNPVLSDGTEMFHADHGNLLSAAASPTVDAVEAARVALASQSAGGEILDLMADIWVGPLSIGGEARVVNDSQYDPSATSKLQRANKVRGLFSDVVDSARVSGAWYTFADPMIAPAIEVVFLEGEEDPVVEMMAADATDGLKMKVRHDHGAAFVSPTGVVKTPTA